MTPVQYLVVPQVLEVAVDGAAVDDIATVERILAPYVDVGGTAFNYHPTEEELAIAEAARKAESVSELYWL